MSSEIQQRRMRARTRGGTSYERRRAEVLRAAARVFRARGFGRTSFTEVAAEIGMDRASLYYYVGGKNELFHDVVLEAMEDNARLAETVQASPASPPEKLRLLVCGLFGSYAEHYPFGSVYLQENLEHIAAENAAWAAEIRLVEQRLFDAVERIMQAGIDDGSIRSVGSAWLLARGLLDMAASISRWYDPDRSPLDATRLGEVYGEMLLVGIAPTTTPGPGPSWRLQDQPAPEARSDRLRTRRSNDPERQREGPAAGRAAAGEGSGPPTVRFPR
jgi:AcrR family transcriptional regulator